MNDPKYTLITVGKDGGHMTRAGLDSARALTRAMEAERLDGDPLEFIVVMSVQMLSGQQVVTVDRIDP